jgi:hypothetical protein
MFDAVFLRDHGVTLILCAHATVLYERPSMRIGCLLLSALLPLALAAAQTPAQTRYPARIYAQLKSQPPPHWCQPQTGDDPAHIISNSCAAYSECLGAVGLQDDVDRPPFSGLSDTQVSWVRKCHQNLYNAARTNPQIKGSTATQEWLQHSVYPGTAARPSAVPPPPPSPR